MSDASETSRRCLITGASGSLGSALGDALSGANWHVLRHRSGRERGGTRRRVDGTCDWISADLSTLGGAKTVTTQTKAWLNGDALDLYVHVAGLFRADRSEAGSISQWDDGLAMFNVHFNSPRHIAQELASCMNPSFALIVLVTSTSAVRATPDQTGYGGTKAAEESLVANLARDLGGRGIRVLAVRPGLFESNMSTAFYSDPEAVSRLSARQPLGRLGTIDDVVSLILQLAIGANRWLTGSILTLDGGSSSGWN